MEHILKRNPAVKLLVKAVLTSFVISAIFLLIISALMLKVNLSSGAVSVFVIATYIISNFISGFIMGKGMEHRKFVWGLASGISYFVILFLLTLIILSSKDFSFMATIRTLLICTISGMAGGMIS